MTNNTNYNYITLNGVKGTQFKKDVMSIQCTVNDVLKFLQIDSNVQRELDENKVASIGQYIQYGLDGNDIYFSPLIFSARGKGEFNYSTNEFNLSMNDRLVILDGQHRVKAFEYLKKRMESNNLINTDKYNSLLNFPLTLQVFMNLTIDEERQLFTDINTKLSQVNNTLIIMYKKDDLNGELVKEVISSLPEDSIECRAKATRTKLMTASTLYSVSKVLNYGVYERKALTNLNKDNYNDWKSRTEEFITLLKKYSPIDAYDRDKYIIFSSNIIVAIAKFVYDALEKYPNSSMEELFRTVIVNVDWSHKNEEFKQLSAKYNKKTKKYNFGTIGRTVKDFSRFLINKYEKMGGIV
ncbi:DNA sulfur modification protein DndB [Cerasibacillus sp. JNUCC 74]